MNAVSVAKLGHLDRIDEGGLATIFAVNSFRLPDAGQLVFKRWFQPMDAMQSANLRALIDFREDLPAINRAEIDEVFTWPLCLVTDGPEVVGFLMRRLGDEWIEPVQQATGSSSPFRSVAWLLGAADFADMVGVAVPPPGAHLHRLVVCAKLSRALAILHRKGVVYGDLNDRNAIFRLDPIPSLTIVDCDSANAPGSTLPQPNALLWTAPECVGSDERQSVSTDCYKLALFIVRCIADGQSPGNTRSPARAADGAVGIASGLDQPGVELLTRALDGDPAQRPGAKEWYVYFRRLINSRTQPPRIAYVRASTDVVFAGASVRIEWHAPGARNIVFETSDGQRFAEVAGAPDGHRDVALIRSGPVWVHATNDYGTSTAACAPVTVISPPQLEIVNVPEPPLPRAEFGSQRQLESALRSTLRSSPAPTSVTLPEMPTLITSGCDLGFDALSVTAADTEVASMLGSLSSIFNGLAHQATALQSLTTDLPETPADDNIEVSP